MSKSVRTDNPFNQDFKNIEPMTLKEFRKEFDELLTEQQHQSGSYCIQGRKFRIIRRNTIFNMSIQPYHSERYNLEQHNSENVKQ